jgi:hypothetical protein
MGLYIFCLCFGFIGLLVMAILGHVHSLGHHAHGHAASHVSTHHGHGPAAHSHHGAHAHPDSSGWKSSAQAWLSPRVLFSVAFAFGASGYLLQNLLPAAVLLVAAVIIAWAFECWLVQPIWRLLFGFASNPARTLESALLEEAQAVTDFDKGGQGLVALDLDGQVIQILGSLTDGDRKFGVRIRTGDRVSITAINPKRNSCTVTRVPSAARPANGEAAPQ